MTRDAKKSPTPLRAIRAKCLDCCADSPGEVRRCSLADCPLHPFRFGRSPKKRSLSAEQRQAAAERLKRNLRLEREQAVEDGFSR